MEGGRGRYSKISNENVCKRIGERGKPDDDGITEKMWYKHRPKTSHINR